MPIPVDLGGLLGAPLIQGAITGICCAIPGCINALIFSPSMPCALLYMGCCALPAGLSGFYLGYGGYFSSTFEHIVSSCPPA